MGPTSSVLPEDDRSPTLASGTPGQCPRSAPMLRFSGSIFRFPHDLSLVLRLHPPVVNLLDRKERFVRVDQLRVGTASDAAAGC